MLKFVRDVFAVRSTWVLFALSFFSIALTLVRSAITGRPAFLFLWWNLFLAFIPWIIATVIRVKRLRHPVAVVVLLVCWIAFFPNAPYILTDFIHLGRFGNAPIWYDLIVLLSFAFTGMLYGFISLHLLETRFMRRTAPVWRSVASAGLIYLACFGIYLGRFLRWNSWDLVGNLIPILSDVVNRIANPFVHRETWGFTALFGTFLNLVYWSYRAFGWEPNGERPHEGEEEPEPN
jgi:uncharacterized membrane protein